MSADRPPRHGSMDGRRRQPPAVNDATGVSPHLAAAGAIRNDGPLPGPTRAGQAKLTPRPAVVTVHLDRGSGGAATRGAAGRRRRRTRGRGAVVDRAYRCPGERLRQPAPAHRAAGVGHRLPPAPGRRHCRRPPPDRARPNPPPVANAAHRLSAPVIPVGGRSWSERMARRPPSFPAPTPREDAGFQGRTKTVPYVPSSRSDRLFQATRADGFIDAYARTRQRGSGASRFPVPLPPVA